MPLLPEVNSPLSHFYGQIYRLTQEEGKWKIAGSFPAEESAVDPQGRKGQPGNPQVNGLAVSPDGERLYAALGVRKAVSVLDLAGMQVLVIPA